MREVTKSDDGQDLGRSFEKASASTNVSAGFQQNGAKSATPKKYPSPVTLRLTEEEKAKLLALASDMSISAYIRQSVFAQCTSKRVVPAIDRVVLAQILGKLGESRMANNLNQIAYQANCGSLELDDATEAEIKQACAAIAWMRLTLMKALGLKRGKTPDDETRA